MKTEQKLELVKTALPAVIAELSADFVAGFNGEKHAHAKASNKDLVTAVDQEIETKFSQWLQQQFPEDQLVAEELHDMPAAGHGWTWYIDPIDGTMNFVHGLPDCAIMIALAQDGVPVLAWIVFPLLGKWFFAEKGSGAYLNGKKLSALKPVPLSQSLLASFDLNDVTEFMALLEPMWDKVAGIRIGGCAASIYAQVASGQVQLGIMPRAYAWEYMCGALLVQEAGGAVTTVDGSAVSYSQRTQDIIVGGSELFAYAAVGKAGKENV